MDANGAERYAVLTGDIVGSSELPADVQRNLADLLRDAAEQTRAAFPEICEDLPGIDVFRGDSWQMAVRASGKALRIALFFRATVKALNVPVKIDTRVGIGMGSVVSLPARVSEGHGEAFVASGEALDALSKRRRMAVRIGPEPEGGIGGASVSDILDILVLTVDTIASDWTPAQALAAAGALRGWTQQQAADAWRRPAGRARGETLTRQAVAQHLDAGQWHVVSEVLSLWESTGIE